MSIASNKLVILTIKDKAGQKVRYQLTRNTQLKCLVDLYSTTKKADPETLTFMFKGCALNTDLTLDELELNNGDVIHACLHKTSYLDKEEAQAHQKSKSIPIISAHPSKAPVSVNGCTINSSIQLEKKMDDLLSVHQQQKNSQVDTMLQHQQEHKKLETKMDRLLSVQQRQQSEINTLLQHQQKQGKQIETGTDVQKEQQSKINTLLHNQQEHGKSLDKKIDNLLFIQQQQQSQIDTLLHKQQEYVKLLESKMDPFYSTQQQQQSQIGTMLQHQQEHGMLLADIMSRLVSMTTFPRHLGGEPRDEDADIDDNGWSLA